MKTMATASTSLAYVLAATLLALAGCQKSAEPAAAPTDAPKPAAVTLVPAAERSRHFDAVSRQLELGGPLYGYVDVDGDVRKLAENLHALLGNVPEMPAAAAVFLNQDFAKMSATLGLTDVKAFGLSSVPDAAGGFRNRIYLHAPDGRHGLLAGLGGAAGPFQHTRLAPADADFYSEGEFDLPVIYAAVKEVVAQAGGATAVNAMEAAVKMSAEPGGVTALEVINSLKGRVVMVGRFDAKQTMQLPATPPLVIPAVSLLIRVDGLGASLGSTLDKLPLFEAATVGTLKVYVLKTALPVEGLRPVLAVENGALWIATTREFLVECHGRAAGLDQSPEFKRALAAVGGEGNSLTYLSPGLFARVRQVAELNPQMEPQARQMFNLVTRQLPDLKEPVISVSANLPGGILIRSHSYRTLKQEVAMVAFYNPVTVGLLAAMAIPAFEKVRASSQEKAIMNNLRQLSTAADQYYLENGVDTATYAKLVGPEKEKYIKAIAPVAGEDYTRLTFKQGQPLRVTTAAGKVVEFGP